MHQSNNHKYKSSEVSVCTVLYKYTSLLRGRLLCYTVGLVSFTPFCLDTIQDFIVGTNTLPRRICTGW